jgi:hypothetical protein
MECELLLFDLPIFPRFSPNSAARLRVHKPSSGENGEIALLLPQSMARSFRRSHDAIAKRLSEVEFRIRAAVIQVDLAVAEMQIRIGRARNRVVAAGGV